MGSCSLGQGWVWGEELIEAVPWREQWEQKKKRKTGSKGDGAWIFGYSDLNGWDGDICTGRARDAEQTGRRSAGQGSRVLSIAVVLKILRGDGLLLLRSGPE